MRWNSIAELRQDDIENIIIKDILELERWIHCKGDIEKDIMIIHAENKIDIYIPKGAERLLNNIEKIVKVKLTCDNIESVDLDITDEQRYKYKQFVIANGFSKIWKDNPYDYNNKEY